MTTVVVFDIDDTLYLERDYARSGFAAIGGWARDELGLTDLGDRAWALFESGLRGTIFNEALAACGVTASADVIPRLVEVYRTHPPTIGLLADVKAWLDARPPKLRIAVVTDGPIASQRAKAEALGLAAWADPIVFTEALGPGLGKPHPAAFERIEAVLGVPGQDCAYVADNPAKDFRGPRARGWRTVRVRRPGSLHAEVPSDHEVDVEITTFDHLDAAFG